MQVARAYLLALKGIIHFFVIILTIDINSLKNTCSLLGKLLRSFVALTYLAYYVQVNKDV